MSELNTVATGEGDTGIHFEERYSMNTEAGIHDVVGEEYEQGPRDEVGDHGDVRKHEVGDSGDVGTTPSTCNVLESTEKKAEEEVIGRADTKNVSCVMKSGKCMTHDCLIEKVLTKRKVWAWIERKKSFGYKTCQTTKLICRGRISTTHDNISSSSLVEKNNDRVGSISSARDYCRDESESNES